MTGEVLVNSSDPRIEVQPEALLALVGGHRFTPKEACTYLGAAIAESEDELGILHVGETFVRVAILKDKQAPLRLGPFRKLLFRTDASDVEGGYFQIQVQAESAEARKELLERIASSTGLEGDDPIWLSFEVEEA